MPEGQVLEFAGITKRFGAVTAVSGFSARVEPGRVTGFLGPNGAGKTTTLRILLGLVKATSGTATIGGVPYARLRNPLQTVGAALEASSFHPGRSAANHLKVYAQAAGLAVSRVEDALGMVGLSDVGGRKVGGFSLGMRQRLGLAYTLLGDPGVLVLDEPANGLDPEGIRWMRGLLRQLASEGRTVLVSSHMLAEVQQTVDALVVISQGRRVFQGALDELTDPSEYATVVDSPDRAGLSAALSAADVPFELLRTGLTVRSVEPVRIGAIAADAGVALGVLQRRGPALEEVFLDLVSGARVHPSAEDPATPVAEPAVAEPGTVAEGTAPEPAPAEDADAVAVDGTAADEPPGTEDATEEPAGEQPADGDPLAGADPAPAPASEEEPTPHVGSEERSNDEQPAGFAVASTGVIDVIPAEHAEAGGEQPIEDRPADGDHAPEHGAPDAGTAEEGDQR